MIRLPLVALALIPAFLPQASAFLLARSALLQQPSFRSSTLGVRVDVLVTEGRKPVAGLGASDFEVRDNGVLQSIQLVDVADVPLNVVLALDTSASTSGARLADLMSASQALLDGLTTADRAALATFASLGARSAVFTADPWWQYHLGAGRDAESLLKALWAGTPREHPR